MSTATTTDPWAELRRDGWHDRLNALASALAQAQLELGDRDFDLFMIHWQRAAMAVELIKAVRSGSRHKSTYRTEPLRDAAEAVVVTAYGNTYGLSEAEQLEALRLACSHLRDAVSRCSRKRGEP